MVDGMAWPEKLVKETLVCRRQPVTLATLWGWRSEAPAIVDTTATCIPLQNRVSPSRCVSNFLFLPDSPPAN